MSMTSSFVPSSIQRFDPAAIRAAVAQLSAGAVEFRSIAALLRSIDPEGWSGGARDEFVARLGEHAANLEVTAGIRDGAATALADLIPAWEATKSSWTAEVARYDVACVWKGRAGVVGRVSTSGMPALSDGAGGQVYSMGVGRWKIASLQIDPWATSEGQKLVRSKNLKSNFERAPYTAALLADVRRRVTMGFAAAEKAAFDQFVARLGDVAATQRVAAASVAQRLDALTAQVPMVVASLGGGGGSSRSTYRHSKEFLRVIELGPKKAASDPAVQRALSDPQFAALVMGLLGPSDSATFYSELPVSSKTRAQLLKAVDAYASDEFIASFVAEVPIPDVAEYIVDSSKGTTVALSSRVGTGLTIRWLDIEHKGDATYGYGNLEMQEKLGDDGALRLNDALLEMQKLALAEGGGSEFSAGVLDDFAPCVVDEDGRKRSASMILIMKQVDGHPEMAADLVIGAPYLLEPHQVGSGAPLARVDTARILLDLALLDPGSRSEVRQAYMQEIEEGWGEYVWDSPTGAKAEDWWEFRATTYLKLINLPNESPESSSILDYPTDRFEELYGQKSSAAVLGALFIPKLGQLAISDFDHARDLAGSKGQPITSDSYEVSRYTEFLRAVFDANKQALMSGTKLAIHELKPSDWGDFLQGAVVDVGLDVGLDAALDALKIATKPVTIAFSIGKSGVDAVQLVGEQQEFEETEVILDVNLRTLGYLDSGMLTLLKAVLGGDEGDHYSNAITEPSAH